MPKGPEGEHQPTDEEQRIIDAQMSEGSVEKAMSEARSGTHEYRDTGVSNVTEIRAAKANEAKVEGEKQTDEEEIRHFAESVSDHVKDFKENPEEEGYKTYGILFPAHGSVTFESYTASVGGPEAWMQRIGEQAGLGNSDIDAGILGEKDGVRVKVKVIHDYPGSGAHMEFELM